MNQARPGDTIRIHAGTYPEMVTVNVNAVAFQPYGDGPVTIDGGCSPARYYGVLINSNDVAVRGLAIQNVMTGIQLNGDTTLPSRAILESNRITGYGCDEATSDSYNAGIAAYYSGPGHRIVGNHIERRPGGDPRGQGDGIYFKSSSAKSSGGGHYIANNTIIGGWDGIGGEVESDARGTFDRNTVIENNTIRDCGDDGIQVEGGGLNVVVRGNTISECGLGVAFANVFTGPLTIQNNSIASSTLGTLGNLACFKTGNRSRATVNLTANNCTTPGDGLQQTNSGLGSIVASANIFNVGRYVYEFTYDAPTGSSFDRDCMATSDPTGRFIKFGGQLYGSLAAFQSGTRQELNGKSGPC